MEGFDHDRFHVYQAAVDFVVVAESIASLLPRGRSDDRDQLQRAAKSIMLNIAEGTGEFALREKVRFYRMAKRSATECAAVLDLVARLGLVADLETLDNARRLLLRTVSMLVALINAAERRPPRHRGYGSRDPGTRSTGKGTGTGTGTSTGYGNDGPHAPSSS